MKALTAAEAVQIKDEALMLGVTVNVDGSFQSYRTLLEEISLLQQHIKFAKENLRDRLAAAALSGIITRRLGENALKEGETLAACYADQCYFVADAMIERRKK